MLTFFFTAYLFFLSYSYDSDVINVEKTIITDDEGGNDNQSSRKYIWLWCSAYKSTRSGHLWCRKLHESPWVNFIDGLSTELNSISNLLRHHSLEVIEGDLTIRSTEILSLIELQNIASEVSGLFREYNDKL